MTVANFAAALAFTLSQEGGFVDNPADPGGATNKGITLVTYQRYVRTNGTVADLASIPDEFVESVYRDAYWRQVNGDNLPAGVDLLVFDMAVNAGPSASAKLLQSAVGETQDGIIGPRTLAATAAASGLVATLAADQMRHYLGLPAFSTFGRGWTNRIFARTVTAAKLEFT